MGTTSKAKLPYPEGTDRVMDGDDAIKALATALDLASVRWACYARSDTVQTFGNSDTNLRINNLTTLTAQINCPALGQASPGNMYIPITIPGWYFYDAACWWGTGAGGTGDRGIGLHSVVSNAFLAETENSVPGRNIGKRQMVRTSGIIKLPAVDSIRMGVWHTAGASIDMGNNILKLTLLVAE